MLKGLSLTQLHIHLDHYNCIFFGLTEDFKHCVYSNPKNGRYVTVKKDDFVKREAVQIACNTLSVPLPGTFE